MAGTSQNPQNADLTFTADLQDNVSPTAAQIEQRLKALGASKHEIKLFLNAYDQATPKIKAAQDQIKNLPKSHMIDVKTNAEQAQKRLEKVRELAKAPVELTVRVKDNVDEFTRNFKMKFQRLEYEMKNAVRQMPITGALIGATSTAANMAAGPLQSVTGLPIAGFTLGAAGGTAAMSAFFAKSFQVNSQMEQNMAQLNQLFKSKPAATQEYQNVVGFATHTPFNMPDVLASDIRLRQIGVNPNNKTLGLPGAGNLAAGTQVPLSQAQGAISAASLGYFESLNNLTGRNIKQQDFTYGGKYAGKTYETAIQDVLRQYTGALQTQTQTFKGLATNIQDVITQKFIQPVGQPLFQAAKGMEQQTASTLGSNAFQLKLSQEVEKLQMGLIKVFQLVQQGAGYFKSSLEDPLKSITQNVVKFGSAMGQAFGGTVLQGVKYLSSAIATIAQPMSAIVGAVPQIGQLAGFLKALHMFGISTNTGVKDFLGGIGHLDIGRTLTGVREFVSLMAKLGAYAVTKSFLDMKNANDQLGHSFDGLGRRGKDALSGISLKFDELIFKAAALDKTSAQIKSYGATVLNAVGIDKTRDSTGKKAGQIALAGGMDAARLSQDLGKGSDVAQILATWSKTMNVHGQIYDQGKNPGKVLNDVSDQIHQAAEQLSKTLGVSLPTAAKDATIALSQFKSTLVQLRHTDPGTASEMFAIQQRLNAPGGMTAKDYGKYGSATELTQQLFSNINAPSIDLLRTALRRGTLNRDFSFKSLTPNAPDMTGAGDMGGLQGQHTSTLPAGVRDAQHILRQYENIPVSSAAENARLRQQIGPGAFSQLGLQLPQFQNVLPGLMPKGYTMPTAAQLPNLSNKQDAQFLSALSTAADNASQKVLSLNKDITMLQATLSKFSILAEEAAGAMAGFQLSTEKQRYAIENSQIALQRYTLGSLNPLQRALAAVSQQMADYQQHSIVPIARAQEDWNQVMLMTSNRLDDISFAMGKAQFNMSKFHDGMLVGENDLTAQIEALSVYTQKLDMLNLLNRGMQLDLSKTQFHQGFTSTVKPLMGFTLQREQQLAQERLQFKQDQEATTYGYQHWKLDRAARPLFQRMEMPFDQRMRGVLSARSIIDTGTLDTRKLQDLQYQEQLKARVLQEAMYAATVKERPLQDKMYELNHQMYQVQRNISLRSDQIAKSQLALQEKQLPFQHAMEHAQNVMAKEQPKIDKALIGKEKQLGDAQDAISAIRTIFGDLNKTFDKNIKADLSNLPAIARDMKLSHQALDAIWGILKGDKGTPPWDVGKQPKTPSGGGGIEGAFNILTHPSKWLPTIITGLDGLGNAVGKLTGSGFLGTLAQVGAVGAAGAYGLSALHVGGAHATALFGRHLSANAAARSAAAEAGTLSGIGKLKDSSGYSALETRLGNWLNSLKEGAPAKMMLHPSTYFMSQGPGALVKWITTGLGTAMGHPLLGYGAGTYLDNTIDNRLGKVATGKFVPFRGTRAVGRYMGRKIGIFETPEGTESIFKKILHPIKQDLGNVVTHTQVAADLAKESRMKGKINELGTRIRPLIAAIISGDKVPEMGGVGADFANNAKETVFTAAKSAATEVRQGVGTAAAAIRGDESVISNLKTSFGNFTQGLQDNISNFQDSVDVQKINQAAANHKETQNADTQKKAAAAQEVASSKSGETARTNSNSATRLRETSGKFNEAEKLSKESSGIQHEASKLFGREGSKFGKFVGFFEEHVGKFGRFFAKGGLVLAAFEFLHNIIHVDFNSIVNKMGNFIGKLGSHIGDFGKFIVNDFKGAIKDFGTAITGLVDFIKKLPGVKNLFPDAKDASTVAREVAAEAKKAGISGSTAEDAAKLNREAQSNSTLKMILEKASASGQKVVEVAGKIFRVAGVAGGIASFVPAGLDAIQGKWLKAAEGFANALSYFIPYVGGARVTQDIGKLLGLPTVGAGQRQVSPGIMNALPTSSGPIGPIAHPITTPTNMNVVVGTQPNAPTIESIPIFIKGLKQRLALQKEWNSLSYQEQVKFSQLSAKQQQQAADNALNGSNGLKSYLDTALNVTRTGYGQINKSIGGALTNQGKALTKYSNGLLGLHSDMYTKLGTTTGDGFSNIGKITGSWLTGLTKQIDSWAKNNNLPISNKNSSVSSGIGSLGTAIAPQSVSGSLGVTSLLSTIGGAFASGGIVKPDQHKVGPGKVVRMVEEGHAEMVIPLAPHRRDHAKSLVKQTHGLLGMAAGGYVYPLSGFSLGRTDMGVDAGAAPGTPIGPIGKARVGGVIPDWYNQQPYINWQLLDGPKAGAWVYVAEQITNLASPGSILQANQAVARFASSGTGIEMGWSMPGAGANALASSHYHEGDVTAEGTDFRNFIAGLAQGKIVGGRFGGAGRPSVPPIHLKDPPKSLKDWGIVGPKQHDILMNAKKVWEKHLNAMSAPAGMGGSTAGLSGNEMQIVQQLAKRFGWTNQIADWTYVLNRESNGTLTDTNPSSGAYGLAQFINGPSEYYTYGGNPNTYAGQLLAMANYIKQRYGDPAGAAAHERAFNWYAGGIENVARDNTPAMLHQGERVLTAAQSQAMKFPQEDISDKTGAVAKKHDAAAINSKVAHLSKTKKIMDDGYAKEYATHDQQLKLQSGRFADHLNAVQQAYVTHWTNLDTLTSEGYSAVGSMSKTYLDQLTNQIAVWAKNNGLTVTSKGSTPGVSSAGGAGVANPATIAITKAHGGLVEADMNKVGPGRIVRMVEEGHPEMVIPLAPHRRDRAKSLLEHTKGLLGFAQGGVIPYAHETGAALKADILKTLPAAIQTQEKYNNSNILPGMAAGGKVTTTGGVQPGQSQTKLAAIIAAANQIASHNFPYLWGGGHTPATFNGPYDCSGAVSAVLRAAGYLAPGESHVSGDFDSMFLPGPGGVTIWSNPTHVFMDIAGRDWGTSGSNPGGGANWIHSYTGGLPGFASHHLPGINSAAGAFMGFGGVSAIPPIKLKDPPNALKQFGMIGPKQHDILSRNVKAWNKHLNSMASTAGGGSFSGTLTGPVEHQVFQFMSAAGFNKIAIAGMLGNAVQESSMNPNTAGGGLWQQISNFGSGTGGSLLHQMQVMLPQIQSLKAAMNAAGSPGNAAVIFEQGFERAGIPAMSNRIAGANAAFAAGYAGGIPEVARNNTPALLHQGERVLNAAENQAMKFAAAPSNTGDSKVIFDKKDHLSKVKKILDDGYAKEFTTHDQQLKLQSQRLADHLNAVQTAYTTHWSNLASMTSQGYNSIGSMSKNYLDELTTQITTWAKNNGLTVSSKGSAPGVSGSAGAAVTNPSSITIAKASGGMVDADMHKIGPGKIVRMVEEGHPEMVIPLAPHRRDHAKNLVDQTRGLLGYTARGLASLNRHAAGGVVSAATGNPYVYPIGPGASDARVDQGKDFVSTGGFDVGAIGDGVVTYSGLWPGWPGTGGLVYKLLNGPRAGGNVFMMEHLMMKAGLGVGAHVKAGQVLGRDLGGYPWLEIGWANSSSTGPLTPYNGAPDGTPMPAGLDMDRFLKGLAHGKLIGGSFGAAGKPVPPIHLKLPPDALKRMGLVGGRWFDILSGGKKGWEKHLDAMHGKSSTALGSAIGGVQTGSLKGDAWEVVASAESLGGSGYQGNAIVADGYSELSMPPGSLNFHALGGLAYHTPLRIAANNKIVTTTKQDIGAGSSFNPEMGLYPGTVQKLGLSGGEFHVAIQRADGVPLHPMGGTHVHLAGGIANVARDNTPAVLHQGEAVLTAAEAHALRASNKAQALKTAHHLEEGALHSSEVRGHSKRDKGFRKHIENLFDKLHHRIVAISKKHESATAKQHDYLKALNHTLIEVRDIQQKALILQIAQQIKNASPYTHRFMNQMRHDIVGSQHFHNRGSIFGPAGTQASNKVDSEIGRLHNIRRIVSRHTFRVGNVHHKKQFHKDETLLHKLEKELHKAHGKRRKMLLREIAKLKYRISGESRFVTKTKYENVSIPSLEAHVAAQKRQIKIDEGDVKTAHDALFKTVGKGKHAHEVARKLSKSKKKELEIALHKAEHIEKIDTTDLKKTTREINKLIHDYIKNALKRGVSKGIIEMALHEMGSGDNMPYTSDSQLASIPEIGKYVPPKSVKIPKHHHHHGGSSSSGHHHHGSSTHHHHGPSAHHHTGTGTSTGGGKHYVTPHPAADIATKATQAATAAKNVHKVVSAQLDLSKRVHGDSASSHKVTHKHEKDSFKVFNDMCTHLKHISAKVEKLNPKMQNNITVEAAITIKDNKVTSIGKGSVRTK